MMMMMTMMHPLSGLTVRVVLLLLLLGLGSEHVHP
jgi:hypothetical protein